MMSQGRILLDVPCKVCGDNSSGKHYGIFACDGCAGFFKRSIRKNRQYRCKSSNNSCPIDKTRRNHCRSCRLRRCLSVGMDRNSVQQERGPRNSSRLANHQQHQQHQFHQQLIESTFQQHQQHQHSLHHIDRLNLSLSLGGNNNNNEPSSRQAAQANQQSASSRLAAAANCAVISSASPTDSSNCADLHQQIAQHLNPTVVTTAGSIFANSASNHLQSTAAAMAAAAAAAAAAASHVANQPGGQPMSFYPQPSLGAPSVNPSAGPQAEYLLSWLQQLQNYAMFQEQLKRASWQNH